MPRRRSIRLVRGTRPGRPPVVRERDRADQRLEASAVNGEGRVGRVNRSSGLIMDDQGRKILFTPVDRVDRRPIRTGDIVEWRGTPLGNGALIGATGVRLRRQAVAEQARRERPLGGLDSRNRRLAPTWSEMVRAFAAVQQADSC